MHPYQSWQPTVSEGRVLGMTSPWTGNHGLGPSGLDSVWMSSVSATPSVSPLGPVVMCPGTIRHTAPPVARSEGLRKPNVPRRVTCGASFLHLWMPFCVAFLALSGVVSVGSWEAGPASLWASSLEKGQLTVFRKTAQLEALSAGHTVTGTPLHQPPKAGTHCPSNVCVASGIQ